MVYVGVHNICSQLDTLQAKLRMRRKEGDPQAARWTKSVSPKHRAESHGPDPLTSYRAGGGEMGCVCPQTLESR